MGSVHYCVLREAKPPSVVSSPDLQIQDVHTRQGEDQGEGESVPPDKTPNEVLMKLKSCHEGAMQNSNRKASTSRISSPPKGMDAGQVTPSRWASLVAEFEDRSHPLALNKFLDADIDSRPMDVFPVDNMASNKIAPYFSQVLPPSSSHTVPVALEQKPSLWQRRLRAHLSMLWSMLAGSDAFAEHRFRSNVGSNVSCLFDLDTVITAVAMSQGSLPNAEMAQSHWSATHMRSISSLEALKVISGEVKEIYASIGPTLKQADVKVPSFISTLLASPFCGVEGQCELLQFPSRRCSTNQQHDPSYASFEMNHALLVASPEGIPGLPGLAICSESVERTSLQGQSALRSGQDLPHERPKIDKVDIKEKPEQSNVARRRRNRHTALTSSPNSKIASKSDENEKKRYECPYAQCDKDFSTSGHARRHSRIHRRLSRFLCPHKDCAAEFTRRDNCTQHQRSRHATLSSPRILPEQYPDV